MPNLVNPHWLGGGTPVTIQLLITATIDDGHDNNGVWSNTSITVGLIIKAVVDGGWRFIGTAGNPLPLQGATITSASFTVDVFSVSNTGGIIIVKDDGDVVCYHIYNRNEFQEYLFNNTRLEQASISRYKFGNFYKENNKILFKLNLQIRFIK